MHTPHLNQPKHTTKACRNFSKLQRWYDFSFPEKKETKRVGKRKEKRRKKNITYASLELEHECIVTQVNVANSRFPQKQGRLFPLRTGCVWGDNWRVPWHAPHSATHKALYVCMRECAAKQHTGKKMWMCVVCVYQREEEKRVIIPFFVSIIHLR